jgi:hypothetical protein
MRRFLRLSLPDYMVPSAFVTLGQLPLTASGKVDRQALPEPGQPSFEDTYLAPRTPLERQLAEIWQEVLGLERVGVRDNFFDLGGHSLLATRMMNRIRTATQVDLPVRSLFEAPTVADIALVIQNTETLYL